MTLIAEIADAVVTALNAASLSLPVAATRSWQPVHTLAELKDLRVTVVPRSVTLAFAAREMTGNEYAVDVGVQQRLETVDAAHIDPLATLAAEIVDFFRGKPLDGVANCLCLKAAIDPVCAPEHLEEFRQFTSVVTLRFKVVR